MHQHGYAPVNGANLYYELSGDGPPLLLIHAGIADSDMWTPQLRALTAHFQVLRFDLRGFGRSLLPPGSFRNVDDVAALLDYLGIRHTHVVGCSYGGLTAIDFALTYPQRVERMVLSAPSIGGVAPAPDMAAYWEQEEALIEVGKLDEATELNLVLWVDGPSRTPAQVDAAVRTEVGRMQMRTFELDAPDDAEPLALDPPAVERLDELTMPVLVLVGAAGPAGPGGAGPAVGAGPAGRAHGRYRRRSPYAQHGEAR